MNAAHSKAIATEVRSLELTVLVKAGQIAWIDQPDEFKKALFAALARASRR